MKVQSDDIFVDFCQQHLAGTMSHMMACQKIQEPPDRVSFLLILGSKILSSNYIRQKPEKFCGARISYPEMKMI